MKPCYCSVLVIVRFWLLFGSYCFQLHIVSVIARFLTCFQLYFVIVWVLFLLVLLSLFSIILCYCLGAVFTSFVTAALVNAAV
jgi:hypothetical protein